MNPRYWPKSIVITDYRNTNSLITPNFALNSTLKLDYYFCLFSLVAISYQQKINSTND